MLGNSYKFQINNSSGVTLTGYVFIRRWKFDSTGALVYGSIDPVINFNGTVGAALASGTSWVSSTIYDNTAAGAGWIGADVSLMMTPGGNANGTVTLLIHRSAYDSTAFSSNGLGEFVVGHTFVNSNVAVNREAQIGY